MSRDGTDPVALDAAMAALNGGEMDGTELLGATIDGRYHLECMLGRGGMGLVYRAHHVGLRRQVAVKILHPSLAASSDVRNRFEREALAVGKIDHPNCVAVYDVGRLPDGSLYLAMELLDGKSLADVLEGEGQIAAGRALHILAHILRGLAHIHNAGLIHRDIKPENIFLIRQGQDEDFAKILDFGIAKPIKGQSDLDDGVKLTQAGMAFGTPIYMAPEQALGNPMDGRADLYAAAVLGYEMLCGQPPFYSEDKLEVMSMHTAKPLPPMRQRMIKGGKPVPSSIERLIAKGLTKKPSDRYPNAEVFLAAVEEALRTPDGGVTDVQFERVSESGSQPLVTEDGQLRLDNEPGLAGIADAISEALSTPPPPGLPVAPQPRVATPPRGLPPQVAAGQPLRPGAPLGSGPALGGVGLGLPYTGPSGEPIFGLTPEQRLAQAAASENSIASALEPEILPRTTPVVKGKRRMGLVYGAIAVAAIVAGVVIAVLTVPRGDEGPERSEPAARALEMLEQKGDPAAALKILDENKDIIDKDPYGQLVLGHAHAARNEAAPALAAYARAIHMDADLDMNERLQTNLRTMAGSKDPEIAAAGFDVWVRTSNPEAKKLLIVAAVHSDMSRRIAVRPVIDKHKLFAEVDWVTAYSLDLQQADTCAVRKEAVAKLRALGDPAAISALERAIVKKGKQLRYKLNACLVDDANAAIGALKRLKKQP